jgi:serine/threonine-protein kinase
MNPPNDVQLSCKYRPIAEIGKGGMGEVCLTVAHGVAGFKKLVVLKRARPEVAEAPECLAMLLDEARLAARLNHPNVVQIYEAGQNAGRYFIAMEYLEGQPLHRIRARIEPRWFLLSMQIRILIEALAGLHYAHEFVDFDGTPLGVIHRDVTPQNIFVTYYGQIKIVDFGIAKVASSTRTSHSGMVRGKVRYMAPEQARCEQIDRRVDIFAVGVMLWEAITGKRMWDGISDAEIIRRLAIGQLPSPEAGAPNSDPEIRRICHRALADMPAHRFATAAELQHELERWLVRQGEEVPPRVVGRFVAAHFEEERTAIKTQLENYCSSSSLRKGMGVKQSMREFEQTTDESRSPRRRPMASSSELAVTGILPVAGSQLA